MGYYRYTFPLHVIAAESLLPYEYTRFCFYRRTSHCHLNILATTMTVPQYPESWQDKAAWAQAKRSASLAKVSPKLVGVPEWDDLPQNSRDLPGDVLTAREIELTEGYTITELLHHLRTRDVSVEEVTRAFLRRAALAHAAVRTHTLSHVNDSMLTNLDQLSYRTALGPGYCES